jgi:hypothetical protein
MSYNLNAIKERFKNTRYDFGYESTIDKYGYEAVCFGIGWNTMILKSITIKPDTIKYDYETVFRNSKPIVKEVPYTDDFYIPLTDEDFMDFIKQS